MSEEQKPRNYWVIRQDVEQLRSPDNSPAIGMGTYLVDTGQEVLLREVSIYSERGDTVEEARRLYMNDPALRIWQDMGHSPLITGRRYRPPVSSALAFGVPYSE